MNIQRYRFAQAALVMGIALVSVPLTSAAQEPLAPEIPAPQPKGNIDSGQINNDPLGGIVINRTMTVLGWDFYKSFSEIWQSLYPDSTFTLTVTERPTAQFGSEMWISYRNLTVFHTFLSPARSGVKEASRQAVNIVHQNVDTIEQERKQIKSDDLGPEEM